MCCTSLCPEGQAALECTRRLLPARPLLPPCTGSRHPRGRHLHGLDLRRCQEGAAERRVWGFGGSWRTAVCVAALWPHTCLPCFAPHAAGHHPRRQDHGRRRLRLLLQHHCRWEELGQGSWGAVRELAYNAAAHPAHASTVVLPSLAGMNWVAPHVKKNGWRGVVNMSLGG